MKKIIYTLILISTIAVPVFFATDVLAQGDLEYTLLTPLPGVGDCSEGAGSGSGEGSGDCTTTLERYLPGIFNLAIGISAAFAVLMIVLGGFQYMSTDSLQGKEEGKKRITNSIYGLVLVIGAWVILYTINPNLLELNLTIDPVKIGPVASTSAGTLSPTTGGGSVNTGSVIAAAKATCPECTFSAPASAYTNTSNPLRPEDLAKFSCASCEPLNGIPTNGNTNTNVDSSIKDNILALNEGLKAQDVSWRLNEAFPPTVHHAASCSYNGTCIDAGLTSNTPNNIKRFIETANNNGLKAQYEVKTADEAIKIRNDLKALGMTGDLTNVVIPVSYINNPHFSVYKK